MNEFDAKAAEWDKNLQHIERAEVIANALIKLIPVNSQMNALEFGAGTGLLSFALKKYFASITMLDSSEEMIRAAQEKIKAEKTSNMKALCLDLENDEFKGSFDIIYNQMVLHHIINIEQLLRKFYSLLTDGGFLAIADLYKEDGSFHGNGFKGHNGFEVEELEEILIESGFKNIVYQTCYIQKKLFDTGFTKEFPIFLLLANK
jgi:tRNA (cmo5U34)-methyltransferase